MAIAIEPAYAALFAALPGLTTDIVPGPFVTKSRRLKHWNDVPADLQPALFQNQQLIPITYPNDAPVSKWLLRADLYVYAYDATETDGGTLINTLVDQVTAALDPDEFTLPAPGGDIYWARIIGPIETDEGKLGAQGMAVIPVELILAD
jgi:hypothetical protein